MNNKTNYNGIQDETIKEIKGHLKVLNSDSQSMQIDIAIMKVLIKRHDKLLWIITGGIIAIILNIVINGG